MNKREALYKRFRLNPKKAKPGDLMAKAKKYKAFPKMPKPAIKAGAMSGAGRIQKGFLAGGKPMNPKNGGFDYMGNVKPSDIGLNNSPAMKHKSMCKMCGKSHTKGKHTAKHSKSEKKHKAIKFVPPSKGHKPKGAHGRAAVKALGRTKTTGNFARIAAKEGKGAAINAYQNALRAHKAGK
jgi:hypothetical protein